MEMFISVEITFTIGLLLVAVAVAVYLHENKVLTINEYKQKLKYIMQTRSYKESKLIRLGPC